MKKMLYAIFFFALFSVLLMYYFFMNDTKNILLLGENIYNSIEKENTFFYDKITYKELGRIIENSDYIIIKDKKIYIDQFLFQSDYVFISADNTHIWDCNKNIGYIDSIYNNIRKKSSAKIIFVINDYNNCIQNKDFLIIDKKVINNVKITDIVKILDSA